MHKKTIFGVLVAGGLLLGCTTPTPPGATASAVASEGVVAQVTAIDRARRLLTLRGADGDQATVHVLPEVRNFGQIAVGDQVRMTYSTRVDVLVAGASRPVSGVEITTDSVRAREGQKPAGLWGISTRRTVRIVNVDRPTHTVIFQEPDGMMDSFTVQNPENFALADNLQPGTNVVVTATDAVAASVEPVR